MYSLVHYNGTKMKDQGEIERAEAVSDEVSADNQRHHPPENFLLDTWLPPCPCCGIQELLFFLWREIRRKGHPFSRGLDEDRAIGRSARPFSAPPENLRAFLQGEKAPCDEEIEIGGFGLQNNDIF